MALICPQSQEAILYLVDDSPWIQTLDLSLDDGAIESMDFQPMSATSSSSASSGWPVGHSSPDATSDSDHNTTMITWHPESQEVILNSTDSSMPADSSSVPVESLNMIPTSESSHSGVWRWSQSFQNYSEDVSFGWNPPNVVSESESQSDIDFPQVTITAFTETGQAESSIKVPLQRSYTGTKPVIPSTLAGTPCATLGVPGLLDLLNSILMTYHTLETPSLSSVLEDCIENNYDFGTAYSRLRAVWSADNRGTILDELRRRETFDREKRRKSIVGNRTVSSALEPRRVWDLYANRVVPWSSVHLHEHLSCRTILFSYNLSEDVRTACSIVRPISHAWMHAKDRVDVQTPINGYEWPVPIPKDASLDLIRIEMLNLGAEYAWLDVLCLRQKGGVREDLREEEWKLDVPTIGSVYHLNKVVVYLNGLGRPLSLKEGDLESDQCWFRRAWTVQEVGVTRIIAGEMPDGPFHAELQDEDGIGMSTKFLTQLQAVDAIHDFTKTLGLSPGMFEVLAVMQNRISTNPVDKVAGVASLLMSDPIPVYYETTSLEDAWTTLVNLMSDWNRGELFFWYPEPGDAGKKWRPSWDQVMNKCLPVNEISDMTVRRDEGTDDDWCYEPCVENGIVRGLAARGAEQVSRRGELIVKDAEGVERTFGILARHGHPIPEDTYTFLVRNRHKRYQIHWVIGRRLSDGEFEKVSVFEMDNEEEIKRLGTLGIFKRFRNILI